MSEQTDSQNEIRIPDRDFIKSLIQRKRNLPLEKNEQNLQTPLKKNDNKSLENKQNENNMLESIKLESTNLNKKNRKQDEVIDLTNDDNENINNYQLNKDISLSLKEDVDALKENIEKENIRAKEVFQNFEIKKIQDIIPEINAFQENEKADNATINPISSEDNNLEKNENIESNKEVSQPVPEKEIKENIIEKKEEEKIINNINGGFNLNHVEGLNLPQGLFNSWFNAPQKNIFESIDINSINFIPNDKKVECSPINEIPKLAVIESQPIVIEQSKSPVEELKECSEKRNIKEQVNEPNEAKISSVVNKGFTLDLVQGLTINKEDIMKMFNSTLSINNIFSNDFRGFSASEASGNNFFDVNKAAQQFSLNKNTTCQNELTDTIGQNVSKTEINNITSNQDNEVSSAKPVEQTLLDIKYINALSPNLTENSKVEREEVTNFIQQQKNKKDDNLSLVQEIVNNQTDNTETLMHIDSGNENIISPNKLFEDETKEVRIPPKLTKIDEIINKKNSEKDKLKGSIITLISDSSKEVSNIVNSSDIKEIKNSNQQTNENISANESVFENKDINNLDSKPPIISKISQASENIIPIATETKETLTQSNNPAENILELGNKQDKDLNKINEIPVNLNIADLNKEKEALRKLIIQRPLESVDKQISNNVNEKNNLSLNNINLPLNKVPEERTLTFSKEDENILNNNSSTGVNNINNNAQANKAEGEENHINKENNKIEEPSAITISNKQIAQASNNPIQAEPVKKKGITLAAAGKLVDDFSELINKLEQEIKENYGISIPQTYYEDLIPENLKLKLVEDFFNSEEIIELNKQITEQNLAEKK